jgi:DNA-binding LytR/AlgR family response regulator
MNNMAASSPPITARAVIADDERLMRDQLRSRLAQVWPELSIVGEAKNGLEAVSAVASFRPDVIFLDIQMPGLTGVEAAREIAQIDVGEDGFLPEIVFVTAYDQYAIEAFEQGVVDYVLKPAELERLRITVQRVQRRIGLRNQLGPDDALDGPSSAPLQQWLHTLSAKLSGKQPHYLEWIQASMGQTLKMIAVQDILFFVSDEKYTRVQTAAQEFLIRKPIKELVDELDPQIFWQIHRSSLVNVGAIAGVQRDERGRQYVLLKGLSERLSVSRSAGHLFRGM